MQPVVDGPTEAEALARHDAGSIHALLHRLPEAEFQAIALAYLDGHTYRQVAILLRLPEGTVKCRIRKGLGQLKIWLDDDRATAQPRQRRGPNRAPSSLPAARQPG